MNIKDYLEQKRVEVDRFLDEVTPPAAMPPAIVVMHGIPRAIAARATRSQYSVIARPVSPARPLVY